MDFVLFIIVKLCLRAFKLLIGWQDGHPAYKKWSGGGSGVLVGLE